LEGGPRRVNHAAVSIGSLIFSFGGYCTGDNYRDPQPIDVFVLNTATYRWTAIKKPENYEMESSSWPYQRYGHTVVAWGKYVVLFGGRSDVGVCNKIYLFNTSTYEWTKYTNRFGSLIGGGSDSRFDRMKIAQSSKTRSQVADKPYTIYGNIPPPRDGHSACIIQDAMYIYGGFVETEHQFCGDVYKLNLKEMEWHMLVTRGALPAYRDFHTATAIGNKMFIFGGRCCPVNQHLQQEEYYCSQVTYFDTETLTWVQPHVADEGEGEIPDGRRSHSALNFHGDLVIFGGYNSVTQKHKNDIWRFDTKRNRWSQIKPKGKGPGPRRRQAVCLVDNRVFLFGGTSPYTGPEIIFSPRQLELMNELIREETLIDHSDLYVLDVQPSLKSLCMDALLQATNGANLDLLEKELELPRGIVQDLKNMTTRNNISQPLRTMASG